MDARASRALERIADALEHLVKTSARPKKAVKDQYVRLPFDFADGDESRARLIAGLQARTGESGWRIAEIDFPNHLARVEQVSIIELEGL